MARAVDEAGPRVDVVVLGATGFTGRLACEYLAARCPDGVSWAMAGRSQTKLEEIRQGLPESARGVPLIVVDLKEEGQVRAMVQRARVVANYAGTPFWDKALPVVAACADFGVHYVDITGETAFMRVSADSYDEKARQTKALICHACGYDSIPSDLGALIVAQEMQRRHGVKCAKIRTYCGETQGGFSGGTIHTLVDLRLKGNEVPGAEASNKPYGLDPPGGKGGVDKGDGGEVNILPHFDANEQVWTVPSVMAFINAKVVRKSNALAGYAYGDAVSYGEVMEVAVPKPLGAAVAYTISGAMALGLALVSFGPTARALLRWVLPAPGEGPSRQMMETGFFKHKTVALGEQADGSLPPARVVARVESGDGGDPGYKCTARMSIEAALCTILDRPRCCPSGGVVTPAFGLGQALVDRLNASGMKLWVEPAEPAPGS